MSLSGREQLSTLQGELVRALLQHGSPPPGFDRGRVQATARSLATKRSRAVARAWPALAGALGDRFEDAFAAYAARIDLPQRGGPLADGRRFARALAVAGELPDAGRLEALAVDLRYVESRAGLRPRRGPAIVAALLKRPLRLVLALRLSRRGGRLLQIPLRPRGDGAESGIL